MGDERCEGCRYWLGPAEHRATDEGVVVGNSGRCRRYPPTLVSHDGAVGYSLPVVRDDDWCGEWRGDSSPATPPTESIVDAIPSPHAVHTRIGWLLRELDVARKMSKVADMAQDYREVNRRVVAEEEKSGSNSG